MVILRLSLELGSDARAGGGSHRSTHFVRSGLDFDQAWTQYLAMGGNETRQWIRAVLDGLEALDAPEHNKLAAALNERFVEMGQNHPVEGKELTDPPAWPDLDPHPRL